MSSWSTVLAMSGFAYDGPAAAVVAVPKMPGDGFKSFWATGTGWGTYALKRQKGGVTLAMKVLSGTLACRSCEFVAAGGAVAIERGARKVQGHISSRSERVIVTLEEVLQLSKTDELTMTVHG
jgi:hypothetical protein